MTSYLVTPPALRPFPGQAIDDGEVIKPFFVAIVDSTGGPATIDAPPTPGQGTVFAVRDGGGAASTNVITIDGNGRLIDGAATCVLDVDNVEAVFVLDAGQWRRSLVPRTFDFAGEGQSAPMFRMADVAASGGGGAPGGPAEAVQYNGGGTFAGSADLTYDDVLKLVLVGGASDVGGIGFWADPLPSDGALKFPYSPIAARIAMAILDSVGTDREILSFGPGDAMTFGSTALDHSIFGATVILQANGLLRLAALGAYVATVGATWDTHIPMHGSAAASSPWGAVDGCVLIALPTNLDYTLTPAEYSRHGQRFSGTLALDDLVMIYPLPASEDETFYRAVTNAASRRIVLEANGSATTQTILAGATGYYEFSPRGVRRIGA